MIFICVFAAREGAIYRQIDAMRRDTQSGLRRLSMKRGGKTRPAHTIPHFILPLIRRIVKNNYLPHSNISHGVFQISVYRSDYCRAGACSRHRNWDNFRIFRRKKHFIACGDVNLFAQIDWREQAPALLCRRKVYAKSRFGISDEKRCVVAHAAFFTGIGEIRTASYG